MRVDPYLFEQHFQAFSTFAEAESGEPLRSIHTHPYLDARENYKAQIHAVGRERLGWRSWEEADIGSGRIATNTVHAIEIEKHDDVEQNNLVPWHEGYGPDSRPHLKLIELSEGREGGLLRPAERALFDLFRSRVPDQTSFERLTELLGRKYSLLAYLLFLKDKTRYAPILTSTFDEAFRLLGADLTTSRKASWENYSAYNEVLQDLRVALAERTGAETTLLDAHSFAYTLVKAVYKDGLPDSDAQAAVDRARGRADEHLASTEKDRKTVALARVGQGKFRRDLDDHWGSCAVTGCTERALLRASHIKPWSACTTYEARDPWNGLLLSVGYDAAFDAGLISFDDEGGILLAPDFRPSDAAAVGISPDAHLRRVETEHLPYLHYHRRHSIDSSTSEGDSIGGQTP